MFWCTSHSEAVAERDLVQLESINRNPPTDQFARELQIASVPLRVVHKVSLTATSFSHVVVHAVGAGVKDCLVTKSLRDVLSHCLGLIVSTQVCKRSFHIQFSKALC